ncbi:MAG: hypothetical protein JWQ36_2316, partial [Enterovirga sp.]|nr:hypothetical protein [Enterovirga sp.]
YLAEAMSGRDGAAGSRPREAVAV